MKDLSKKYYLGFKEFHCTVASIKVNDEQAGLVYLPPYQIDITRFLKKGKNKISLEVVSSLRNLLGPHHQKNPNPKSVSPASFLDKENWTDFYTTLPFGLGTVKLKIVKYSYGKFRII